MSGQADGPVCVCGFLRAREGLRAPVEHAEGGRRRFAAAHQIGLVLTGGGRCELMF
jgi:hypothetical protein